MTRLLTVAAVSGLLLWAGSAWMPSHADAQSGNAPDPRFAGLQWTFVRIRYTAWTVPPGSVPNPEDEPWFIDAPAAEQNLSRRVRTVTPSGRVVFRTVRDCGVRPGWNRPNRCRWVRERVVRPNGRVVYREVRRCR